MSHTRHTVMRLINLFTLQLCVWVLSIFVHRRVVGKRLEFLRMSACSVFIRHPSFCLTDSSSILEPWDFTQARDETYFPHLSSHRVEIKIVSVH